MPLRKIPATEAWATLQSNRYSGWGNRLESNRVEPVAEPAFPVPFTLNPNSAIFTIGSCFARVIESQLGIRGYAVPMLELSQAEDFKEFDSSFLNNFGTPSIFYELASAFGEFDFDESALFKEVKDGLFADMQLVHSVPLASLAVVRARRAAIWNATRMLARCDVLIMTLGLTEVWWDEQAQVYLNVAPYREIVDREPDRYSLCLLDFAESYDFLERALDVAFRHGRDDLQVLITVSPVPLITTFLQADVISASCYSKSLLRTAAEQAAMRFDRVSYLPLYETVMLSDRQLAWQPDLRHVSKGMVNFVVSRVLGAFAPDGGQQAKPNGWAAPTRNFEEFAAQLTDEGAAAALKLGQLRVQIDNEQYDEAVASADAIGTELSDILKAKALIMLGRLQEAIAIVEPICRFGTSNDPKPWEAWVEAVALGGSSEALQEIEAVWRSRRPNLEFVRLKTIAPAMSSIGDTDGALGRFAELLGLGRITPPLARSYTQLLLDENRPDEALTVLDELEEQIGRSPGWAAQMRAQAHQNLEETP